MPKPLMIVKANSLMLYLLRRDGWSCWYCSKALPPIGSLLDDDHLAPSVEHLIPKSRRGDPRVGHPNNLRLAHRRCNVLAADMPMSEKLALRARLSGNDV